MKTLLFFALILLSTSNIFSQTWQWTRPERNGDDQVNHVATDAQGNLYVLGIYYDSLYLGGVGRAKDGGSYIAKYDSTGNLLWYNLITNTLDNVNPVVWANDMVVNSQGVFLVGYIYGHDSQFNYSIGSSIFTADTAYYPTGRSSEFFFCKIDFNGNVVWNKQSKRCNNGLFDRALSIGTDKQDNLIIGGTRSQVSYYNGTLLHSFTLSNDNIVDNTTFFDQDFWGKCFFLKYDPNGNFKWSNFANKGPSPASGNVTPYVVSITSDYSNNIWTWVNAYDSTYFGNQLFKTNHRNQNVEVLSKLNGATGAFITTKELSTYGIPNFGGGAGKPHLLTTDSSNNVYAFVSLSASAGQYNRYLNKNINVTSTYYPLYILKYNKNQKLLWYKKAGNIDDNSYSYPFGYEINYYKNKLYISGSLPGNGTNPNNVNYYFPPLTIPIGNISSNQSFVAKSDTAGNFEWVNTVNSFYAEALSVAASGNIVYSGGYYRGSILNLGNLSGFKNPDYFPNNQFTGALKDRYIRIGKLTPTILIPGCSVSIPFTSYGYTFSPSNTFTAELSDVFGGFNFPLSIGSIISTGNGVINGTIPNTNSNLNFSSGYKIRIKSSDTLLTGYPYYAYADTGYTVTLTCSPAPSGLVANAITKNTATLNWNILPCASGYRVQYRIKGTTTWTIRELNTNIGSLSVTGLTANSIYEWQVATKCKSGSNISYSAYSPIQEFTTLASFAAASYINNTQNVITNNSGKSLTASLSPNPADNNVTIAISNAKGNTQIVLMDLSGKIIWERAETSEKNLRIDIKHLSSGTYFISVFDQRENVILKLVKR